jgi:hypothetical protein
VTRLYCPTTQALLLLGVRAGEPAILRAPDALASPPGRLFTPRPLIPIDEQLAALALEIAGPAARSTLTIEQEYTDLIPIRADLPAGHPEAAATLYLATCELPAIPAGAVWPSFPELLRAMPKDRARLPYLRAFQVLSGGLHLNTKAIEASELAKYFPEEPQS